MDSERHGTNAQSPALSFGEYTGIGMLPVLFTIRCDDEQMNNSPCDIGMVGLGVMGRNLLLNMADRGYTAAGYDMDPGKVRQLLAEAGDRKIREAASLSELIGMLRPPRTVMVMVPAGRPVDAVIADLLALLAPHDIIIDGGNSHFRETERRQKVSAAKSIDLLGVGISGGEYGARHGPSIMPGGSSDAYDRVRPIFEAIAARVGDDPCVTYLGPGGAGHYVKMVHNGIEYGLMQSIAETYHLLKAGLGYDNDKLHNLYDRWNNSELGGYLMEITADIFSHRDEQTGKSLIDVIRDAAEQKGTGMWTSQEATSLKIPLPTVDMAVVMRDLSGREKERAGAYRVFGTGGKTLDVERPSFESLTRNALYASMIIVFSQGLHLLRAASDQYAYSLHLADIARIWRGGCIIRAQVLDLIHRAFSASPELAHLLLDPAVSRELLAAEDGLRSTVQASAAIGVPTPALSASLSYLDAYRSPWLPANLIQAQRDYFGSHMYERIDAVGAFHTDWTQE
jgi:6-phosphogluconate dehydrogenase